MIDPDGNAHQFASLAEAHAFADSDCEISHITNRRLVESVEISREEAEAWMRKYPNGIEVVDDDPAAA